MRPHNYCISINYRQVENESVFQNIFSAITNATSVGVLVRDVLENCDNYESALQRLAESKLVSPTYILIVGTKKNQAVLLTRDRASLKVPPTLSYKVKSPILPPSNENSTIQHNNLMNNQNQDDKDAEKKDQQNLTNLSEEQPIFEEEISVGQINTQDLITEDKIESSIDENKTIEQNNQKNGKDLMNIEDVNLEYGNFFQFQFNHLLENFEEEPTDNRIFPLSVHPIIQTNMDHFIKEPDYDQIINDVSRIRVCKGRLMHLNQCLSENQKLGHDFIVEKLEGILKAYPICNPQTIYSVIASPAINFYKSRILNLVED